MSKYGTDKKPKTAASNSVKAKHSNAKRAKPNVSNARKLIESAEKEWSKKKKAACKASKAKKQPTLHPVARLNPQQLKQPIQYPVYRPNPQQLLDRAKSSWPTLQNTEENGEQSTKESIDGASKAQDEQKRAPPQQPQPPRGHFYAHVGPNMMAHMQALSQYSAVAASDNSVKRSPPQPPPAAVGTSTNPVIPQANAMMAQPQAAMMVPRQHALAMGYDLPMMRNNTHQPMNAAAAAVNRKKYMQQNPYLTQPHLVSIEAALEADYTRQSTNKAGSDKTPTPGDGNTSKLIVAKGRSPKKAKSTPRRTMATRASRAAGTLLALKGREDPNDSANDTGRKRKLDDGNESSTESYPDKIDEVDSTHDSNEAKEFDTTTEALVAKASKKAQQSAQNNGKSPPWYPSDHPNAKFPTLNSLNMNLMDRNNILGQIKTENVLREIILFKKSIGEEAITEARNSKTKRLLVPIPVSNDKNAFYKRAKTDGWIEGLLKQALVDKNKDEEGNVNDAIHGLIEYFVRRHRQVTFEALQSLNILPSDDDGGGKRKAKKKDETKVVEEDKKGGHKTDKEKDAMAAAIRKELEKNKPGDFSDLL